MDHYVVELVKRIKKQRLAQAMTQAQLAEKAGITAQYLSHIENGNQKMSIAVFSRVCDALNVSADKILYNRSDSYRKTLINYLPIAPPTERYAILHLVQEVKKLFRDVKESP